MTGFIIFLIYIGGVEGSRGFWKAVFWPYFLGEKLVSWVFNENTFPPKPQAPASPQEAPQAAEAEPEANSTQVEVQGK